jgi:hypothetical protein
MTTETTTMTNGTESKQKVGRKPIDDKKIPVTIYRSKSNMDKLGGRQNVRKMLNTYLDNQ